MYKDLIYKSQGHYQCTQRPKFLPLAFQAILFLKEIKHQHFWIFYRINL